MGFASLQTNDSSLFIVGGNERWSRGGCWWGKKSKKGGKESDWRDREREHSDTSARPTFLHHGGKKKLGVCHAVLIQR